MSEKFAADRKKYEHNGIQQFSLSKVSGQTIYEWDQNIEEVNVYIKTPEGTYFVTVLSNVMRG
jgi:hypothetical protein